MVWVFPVVVWVDEELWPPQSSPSSATLLVVLFVVELLDLRVRFVVEYLDVFVVLVV